MPVNTRHRLDKLVIGSSFTLDQINSSTSNFNMDLLSNHPAGHIAPMSLSNRSQDPEITVTTPELDTVLGALALNGLSITADSYLYQKLATETGTVARATTSHTRHVISALTTYWTSISLPHNNEGTLELVVKPVWDGTNDIIAPAGGQALTTTLAGDPRYGCGPVSINNTPLLGVQNIEVVSGVECKPLGASSELWNTSQGIQKVAPIVRVTTTDIALASIDIEGTNLDGTNGLVFWARRLHTADGSSHHIKFIGLTGKVDVESESGSGTDDYVAVLRFTLTAGSDSVMPLTYTTAQAIA